MINLESILIYYSKNNDVIHKSKKPLSFYIKEYFYITREINNKNDFVNINYQILKENLDVLSYLIYVIDTLNPFYSYNKFLYYEELLQHPFTSSITKNNSLNIIINESLCSIIKETIKYYKLLKDSNNVNYRLPINKLFNFLVSIKKSNIQQLISNLFEFLFDFTIYELYPELFTIDNSNIDNEELQEIKNKIQLYLYAVSSKKYTSYFSEKLKLDIKEIYYNKFLPKYIKLFKVTDNTTHIEFLYYSFFITYFIHYFFNKKLGLLVEEYGIKEENVKKDFYYLTFWASNDYLIDLRLITICSILINEILSINNYLFIHYIDKKFKTDIFNSFSNSINLPIIQIYKDIIVSLYGIYVETQKQNNKPIIKNNIYELYEKTLLNNFLQKIYKK